MLDFIRKIHSKFRSWAESYIITFLTKVDESYTPPQESEVQKLMRVIQRGDLLLVEGNQRFSNYIKFITKSNWSHVAIYIGDGKLLEADIQNGVQIIELSSYSHLHTRICRPKSLSDKDIDRVINYLEGRNGIQYDMKLIFDLLKYILYPPIPDKLKRRFMELGSKETNKVICSSLIAEAFHYIDYPILPVEDNGRLYRSHRTLITPGDYDISPYFEIIKPTLHNFNYRDLEWGDK